VSPIHAPYRGFRHLGVPANGQGIVPLVIARTLEHFDVGSFPVDSVQRLHLLAEDCATRLRRSRCGCGRSALLRGWPSMKSSVIDMQDGSSHIASSVSTRIVDLTPPRGRRTATTVISRGGRPQSEYDCFINSIFDEFGSGIVAPASGIVLTTEVRASLLNPDIRIRSPGASARCIRSSGHFDTQRQSGNVVWA